MFLCLSVCASMYKRGGLCSKSTVFKILSICVARTVGGGGLLKVDRRGEGGRVVKKK